MFVKGSFRVQKVSVSYLEVVLLVFMQVFFSCSRRGLSVFVKASFHVQIMCYFR